MLLFSLHPRLAWSSPPESTEESTELVIEALYLCDPVPPGGHEVSLATTFVPGATRDSAGALIMEPLPRVQVAVAFSDRLGLTADVGLATEQGRLVTDAPSASLKYLLIDPAGGRVGLAASLDLLGSTRSLAESELGIGLGTLRGIGPITVRAGLAAATTTGAWAPHLHAGASAALALSSRVRALAEVVASVGSGARTVAAGPTIKVALAPATSLTLGALLPVSPGAGPMLVTLQVAQGI